LNLDDDDEKQPQQKRKCIQFHDIPDKVIEYIFQFIDNASLLDAAEVSLKWNEIVSSSTNLQLVFDIPISDVDLPEKFTRPYRSVSFEGIVNWPSSLWRKLKTCRETVTSVEIIKCSFERNEFTSLMYCFPNIQKLNIDTSNRSNEGRVKIKHPELAKLKTIRCVGAAVGVS